MVKKVFVVLIKLIFIFIYLFLLYFCLPLWTIIWKELIKYSCEFYVCSNVVYPREVPYIMISYITISNFIFFILPLWGIIGMLCFFVLKKLHIWIKEEKYIKILIWIIAILIFVRIFYVILSLWLIIDYETEFKLIDFHLNYSLEIRNWPLKILSDVFFKL